MLTQTVEVPVRYCEDCKYFKKGGHDSHQCSHPLTKIENVVQRNAGAAYCSIARGNYGSATTCGPDGKYWRERERVKMPISKRRFWRGIGWRLTGL